MDTSGYEERECRSILLSGPTKPYSNNRDVNNNHRITNGEGLTAHTPSNRFRLSKGGLRVATARDPNCRQPVICILNCQPTLYRLSGDELDGETVVELPTDSSWDASSPRPFLSPVEGVNNDYSLGGRLLINLSSSSEAAHVKLIILYEASNVPL